jgi:predicted amidohydrolase YtcJ
VLVRGSASAATEPPADLVVRNGRVLTVDAGFRVVEAVAIRGGVFIRVGTNAEVQPLVGRATRVIDAGGMSVVPGLIDTHVHALGVAAAEAVDPFRELRSVAELQDWVREKARRTPEGQWIWTPRTYPPRIRELRFPTRPELDAATDRHPVVVDGAYALMLNTRALAAAGITRETPAPQGGIIVRDADGQPTGLLRNVGPMLARYQERARDDRGENVPLELLEEVHRRYNRVGITSVIERGAGLEGYRAYRELENEGRLHVRATVTLRLASDGTVEGAERAIRALGIRFGEGDERVKVGPLKVVVDGGILLGNAYMRDPYGRNARALYGFDDPGYRGSLSLTPDQIENVIRTGHRLGWQMCSHVTGDAGVDAVLDAVEAADGDSPIRERRYTLIHAYFPDAATARRAARLGVCVDTQPAWYYKDADVLANALGEDRLRPFIGLAAWMKAGVKVALNTDHMFGLDPRTALNPFDPFLTPYVAVTRKTERGRVIGPEQAVSRQEALRMMTADAAYLSFDEKRKGSIEVGKLGDLAVLSEDFMACPPDRIREVRVVATVLGGKIVHEAGGAGAYSYRSATIGSTRIARRTGLGYRFVK